MSASDTTEVLEPARTGGNRLLKLLAVLVALVVGAGLWVFALSSLFGGEEVNTDAMPPSASAPQDTSEAEVPTDPGEDATEDSTVIGQVTYDVYLARDPFAPVVPASSDVGVEATVDADEDESTDADGAAPGPMPTDDESATQLTSAASAAGDARSARLVFAGADTAIVRIDGTAHDVAYGEVFAHSFLLRATSSGCAELTYGDELTSLCEGDERVLR